MTNTVATTILQQLGGGRFTVITGARNFLGHADGLQFDLPNHFAKDGINRVLVKLNDADLYDLTFYKIAKGGMSVVTIATESMVYADNLRRVFTAATGLDTNL